MVGLFWGRGVGGAALLAGLVREGRLAQPLVLFGRGVLLCALLVG